jgi:hypothetical protein
MSAKPEMYKCERCGELAVANPWPAGWVQCGKSRFAGFGGTASWCPCCKLAMPAGSIPPIPPGMDLRNVHTEMVALPPRLPDYEGKDAVVVVHYEHEALS